jgi:hypothetical protein
MRTYKFYPGKILAFCAFFFTIIQNLPAQNAKCPPLIIPSVSYQYQDRLHSAVGAELNFWFVSKKCDCSATLGALCYLWGPTSTFKIQSYPAVKGFDVAGSFGYRFIFLKPEITAGYTAINESYGKDFFHLDPAFGIDAAIANISFGYSFRTVKIDNKIGSFFFRVAFTPSVFFRGSGSRRVVSSYSNATRSQIRSVKATF